MSKRKIYDKRYREKHKQSINKYQKVYYERRKCVKNSNYKEMKNMVKYSQEECKKAISTQESKKKRDYLKSIKKACNTFKKSKNKKLKRETSVRIINKYVTYACNKQLNRQAIVNRLYKSCNFVGNKTEKYVKRKECERSVLRLDILINKVHKLIINFTKSLSNTAKKFINFVVEYRSALSEFEINGLSECKVVKPYTLFIGNFTAQHFVEALGSEYSHSNTGESYFSFAELSPNNDIVLQVDSNGVIYNFREKKIRSSRDCNIFCNFNNTSKTFICNVLYAICCSDTQNIIEILDSYRKFSHNESGRRKNHYCSDECPCFFGHLDRHSCHIPRLRTIMRKIRRIILGNTIMNQAKFNKSYKDLQHVEDSIKRLSRFLKTNLAVGILLQEVSSCEIVEKNIFEKYRKQFLKINEEKTTHFEIVCVCCQRLMRKRDVICLSGFLEKKVFEERSWLIVRSRILCEYYGSEEDVLNNVHVCRECRSYLDKDKIPPLGFFNQMDVDVIPETIKKLNTFEKLFIQKQHCFQNVCRLEPFCGKRPAKDLVNCVKGMILYRPMPLDSNIKMLPKSIIDGYLEILVNGVPTKKKIVWQQFINIKNIYDALVTLRSINPFYVDLLFSWEELESAFDSLDEENENIGCEGDVQLLPSSNAIIYEVSDKKFNDEFIHYMMHPTRIVNKTDGLQTYQMKANTAAPVSIWEKNIDLLSFPVLFPCGRYGKNDNSRCVKLTDSKYRTARLRHKDNRFRTCVPYLFHSLYDSEIKNANSAISHLFSLKENTKLSVQQFLNCIQQPDPNMDTRLNSLLSNVRGTQEFWYKRRQELLTMMDYYGPPTWFVTLSCAEYDWDDLICHLQNINKEFIDVKNMTVGNLCSFDPVTVCQHFNARFQAVFRNLLMCKENSCLGEVVHFFWRREYQSRGAPHIHMLLWIKGAPILGQSSDEEVIRFIEKYVTCKLPNEVTSPELYKLVSKYQIHKCRKYCRRSYKVNGKWKVGCKFSFPRPVLETSVLCNAIKTLRHRMNKRKPIRLYDLQRQKSEMYINDYNPALLLGMEANIDVQFIGDASMALARYITGYVSKHKESSFEKSGNVDYDAVNRKSVYWKCIVELLKHRQCGAYEAADRLLSHKLFDKSVSCRYLNTNYPNQRKRVLKSFTQLQEMKDKSPYSREIFKKSWLEYYYPERPISLDKISLFQYASSYDIVYSKQKKNNNCLVLLDGETYIRQRKVPHLIQYTKHHYEGNADERENYCHSLVLLFVPWRDENFLCSTFKTWEIAFNFYIKIYEDLKERHQNFVDAIDLEQKIGEELKANSPETSQDEVLVGNIFEKWDPPTIDITMSDLIECMMPNGSEGEVLESVSKLNEEQMIIFKTITSALGAKETEKIRTKNSEQILSFVSGPGGTGKTFVIKLLRSWINKHYNLGRGKISIVVCAPTGLAALNISGVTIHKAFSLSVDDDAVKPYTKLSVEHLSFMRKVYKTVKLIIIDEISMVSNLVLNYIHLRLQEIMDSEELFGGKNILVLGDLLQLPPVQGSPIYMSLKPREVTEYLGGIGNLNLWRCFEYFELVQNVRQSGDNTFQELLNRLRKGEFSLQDRSLLEKRIIRKPRMSCVELLEFCKHELKDEYIPIIFPRIRQCVEYNMEVLQENTNTLYEIMAVDVLDGHIPNDEVRECALSRLKRIFNETNKTGGLVGKLQLKKNIKVMLVRNIDIKNGFVNGLTGRVKSIVVDCYQSVTTVEVLFENFENSTLIKKTKAKFEIFSGVFVKRTQFPLVLAHAVTCHKIQGTTMSTAIIDIGSAVFGAGMIYVALSRVTALNNLHILDSDFSKIKADQNAIKEYERLKTQSVTKTKLAYTEVSSKICYDNIEKSKKKVHYQSKDRELKFSSTKEIKDTKLSVKCKRRAEVINNVLEWNNPPFKRKRIENTSTNKFNEIKEKNEIHINMQFQSKDRTLKIVRKYLEPIPLENNCNICFANSTVQILLSLFEFRNIFMNNVFEAENSICFNMKKLVLLYNNIEPIYGPFNIQCIIRLVDIFFDDHQQHDCWEFFDRMLRKLTVETPQFNDLFMFKSKLCYHCESCSSEWEDESMISQTFVLNLNSEPNIVSFNYLLNYRKSHFDICVHCKQNNILTKPSIVEHPILLYVVFLTYDENGKKLNNLVTGCDGGCLEISGKPYYVVSAIQHIGNSINCGHYVGWVKDERDSNWFYCNDSTIRKQNVFIKDMENVYILLLRRGEDENTGIDEIKNILNDDTTISKKCVFKNNGTNKNYKTVLEFNSDKEMEVDYGFKGLTNSNKITRKILEPLPLENRGNVCFANSIIQVLISAACVREEYFNLSVKVTCEFTNIFRKLIDVYMKQINLCGPFNIEKLVEKVGYPYDNGKQHDCWEFFEKIFEKMQNATSNISDLFTFKSVELLKCCSCNREWSLNVENKHCLIFNLKENFKSVNFESLTGFTLAENEVCGTCQSVMVYHKLQIYQHSTILFAILPRYKQNGEKLNTLITKFNAGNVKICNKSYSVIGVIQHVGNTIQLGHYVTWIKDTVSSGWYLCDDSTICKRKQFVKQLKDVYVLLLKLN